MCPHPTVSFDVQIQFGIGKRVLDFEKREQIVREDGSNGGLGVTWRTEQVVHGGTYAKDSGFTPRKDLKSNPRALFEHLFNECHVMSGKMNYGRASVFSSAMSKGGDLLEHLINVGNWQSPHGKNNAGNSVANQSYNFGGMPLRALASLAGFRSVNGSVAYVLWGSRDTIVVPQELKDAYAGGLKNRVNAVLKKYSKTNDWPKGVNDAPALKAFAEVLDYLADVFWQDAAHLYAVYGEKTKNGAFWNQDVFTSSTTRDAWLALVQEAKSRLKAK